MNPFMLAQAVLSFAAAIHELRHGNYTMSIVYAAWSISNFALATVGRRA